MMQVRFISWIRLGLLDAASACAITAGCSSGEVTGMSTTSSGVTSGSRGMGGSGGMGGAPSCSGQACMAVELAHVDYWMGRPVLDEDHVYWTAPLTKIYGTGTSGPEDLGGVVVSVPKTGGGASDDAADDHLYPGLARSGRHEPLLG